MMSIVKLKNFVPVNEADLNTDWILDYKEGEYFRAFCESKDKKVSCEYSLDSNNERLLTKAYDKYTFPYEKVLKDDKKVCFNNDGSGVVRLSGGWVSNRYGFFRRSEFQDFLDKYHIDAISKVSPWNFHNAETVYIIDKPGDALYMPEKSCVEILNGRQHISSNRRMTITSEKSSFLIVSVKRAPFWIHESKKNGKLVRRLYVNKDQVNCIMSLGKDLDEMMFA